MSEDLVRRIERLEVLVAELRDSAARATAAAEAEARLTQCAAKVIFALAKRTGAEMEATLWFTAMAPGAPEARMQDATARLIAAIPSVEFDPRSLD